MLLNYGAGEDSWESFGLQRRPNQSILKEINPEYSLEGPLLKLQYFGLLMQRADLLEKGLVLEKIESKRRTAENEMVKYHHWLNEHEFEQTLRDSQGQRSLAFCSQWGCEESDTTCWLNNITQNYQSESDSLAPGGQMFAHLTMRIGRFWDQALSNSGYPSTSLWLVVLSSFILYYSGCFT